MSSRKKRDQWASKGRRKPGKAREKSDQILQFKVELEGVEPPVWRRIQVPSNYTFWDLHVAMQDAMGWLDYHLHAFSWFERGSDPESMVQIGIPDPYGDDPYPVEAGWEVPLALHFQKAGDRMLYEYDFGDGWTHRVELEEVLPRPASGKYPRCVAGARACPPEDCGGPHGYEQLLAALADPGHEDHEQMMEWLGEPIDPEKFDPKAIRFDDPDERLDMMMEDWF